MKINKNYCKFVSQVKSSQVKSSAKIVSLITLFILLFSISCKSKQNPEDNPKYLELEGTWTTDTYVYGKNRNSFTVYSDGNIVVYGTNNYYNTSYTNYTNTKKIDDNFDYPYTAKVIKVVGTYANPETKTQTITFESASKATVSGDFEYGYENYNPVTKNETHNFTKQ